MKIILDLQATQTASRYRGIGRYSLALARAIVDQGAAHEIHVGVNQGFADTLEDLRSAFPETVRAGRFWVWCPPTPVAEAPRSDNNWRARAAELIQEAWLQELRPDLIHVSSLFEGWVDDAVTFVSQVTTRPTVVTLYDLIPYLYRERYLTHRRIEEWYLRKLTHLRKADLVFAISEHSRREAVETLGLDPDRIVTVSPAADAQFRRLDVSTADEQDIRMRLGLKREFLMYAGGTDYRKNVEGLIEAYALLPHELRREHCLALVCKTNADERERILQFAQSKGLFDGEVVITGYVSDEDLVGLYNLCKLFVLPSLHEGFGLPALEAMSCGAPVIGSDQSAIPEVIGWRDALFDPTSAASVSAKIREALINDQFRDRLTAHGEQQARKFSWRDSALRALEAFESVHERRNRAHHPRIATAHARPRLAYLSPLPPERSGIANYSVNLLPELAHYYDIDLVTDLRRVSDPYLNRHFRRRSVAAFEKHAHDYDQILYHFGNSALHSHMLSLIQRHPGAVVLHDFFLSGLMHHLETAEPHTEALRRSLYQSHGYHALLVHTQEGAESALETFPCNLPVVAHAQGVIVHSQYAKRLAQEWLGANIDRWITIPQLRKAPTNIPRERARLALGVPPGVFLVCTFGILHPRKLSQQLLEAWFASALAEDSNCHLVFVGDGQSSDYERALKALIESRGSRDGRVRITGYVDDETYGLYLGAADLGVQLRTSSRGETSRAVLDCLAYGIATIVNDYATLGELPSDVVMKAPAGCNTDDLPRALELLQGDHQRRRRLGGLARRYVEEQLNPKSVARQYAGALETFAREHPLAYRRRLFLEIGRLPKSRQLPAQDLARAASCIAENSVDRNQTQLLVDVSRVVVENLGTGIERAVRGIVAPLLEKPPTAYRVEPVYRSDDSYHYARRFALDYLGLKGPSMEDAPAAVYPNDVFLGLDWDPNMDDGARQWLLHHKQRGMRMYSVLYDLLPLRRPEWFPAFMERTFREWLMGLWQVTDGFVCISQTMADELMDWLEAHDSAGARAVKVGYFPLGANLEVRQPSHALGAQDAAVLAALKGREVLLMVGTVEARKGHGQALAAVERLWAEGEEVRLVIAGRTGWMVEPLVERLKAHPEQGRRLFWLERAGDEMLEQLYRTASALLMVSEGEGFGLPLIEAARYGCVPIIARDLRVFREVAKDHAFYFSGIHTEDLAAALRTWLRLYRLGEHPRSDALRWLTWKQSAEQLLRVILQDKWYRHWNSGAPGFGFERAALNATTNHIGLRG